MESAEIFLQKCSEVAQDIITTVDNKPVRVFSHFDADGLAAASLIVAALDLMDFNYQLTILERLEQETLSQLIIGLEPETTIIFTDLGTNFVNDFAKWPVKQVFILDHHEPPSLPEKLPDKVTLLNPHLDNIDGSVNISGAGVTYLVVKNWSSELEKFSPVAIIGALGDRQDQGINSSLIGLNKIIVSDAKKLGLLSDDLGVWFYERSRSIIDILRYQKIPRLTNEVAIVNMLDSLGIAIKTANGSIRTFYDLTIDEQKRLISTLIGEYGVLQEKVLKKDYRLLGRLGKIETDARVFATRLNACGRMQRPDIGISLCFGDLTAINDFHEIKRQYSRLISNGLSLAQTPEHLEELSHLYVLKGKTAIPQQLIGTITSIISSDPTIIKEKPVLGWAVLNDKSLKISVRLPINIGKKDEIDIFKALKEALTSIQPDADVGGHKAAAGAIIKSENLELLITTLNRILSMIKK